MQGESIGQTFNFVKTGNADVGFGGDVAGMLEGGQFKAGSDAVIPQTHYDPIRQDAVPLKKGAGNEAKVLLEASTKPEHQGP